VKSGKDTAFTLNFVYSTDPNGYGALLTTAEGKAVTVTAAQGTTSWTITPNLDSDLPNWTLTPPPDTALFGTGVDSTIAFAIANLVTQFQPGPTVVLIGYSGVPGYKNGSFAVTLTKEPHVLITSFTASHDQIPLGSDGTAEVVLSWSTAYATQLTLITGAFEKDVTGHTTWTVSLTDTTDFQLIASGSQPGGADNRAISQIVPVSVLPVINSFEIVSAEPSGDAQAPVAVTLAWNVTTNAEFVLIDEGNGTSQAYGPVAQCTFNTTPPAPATLTAKAGLAGPTATATASFPSYCWAFAQITCPTDTIIVKVGWNNLPSPQMTRFDILVERPSPIPPWSYRTQTTFSEIWTWQLDWSLVGSGSVTVVATALGPEPLPANLSITASASPA
jgi:hypothetical protein